MNNVKAIFIKQCTSHIKMPIMLIQGLMFLGMAAAFVFLFAPDEPHECYVCIPAYVCYVCQEIEDNRFQLPTPSPAGMFAAIFVGMAMIGATAQILTEEKTTSNLRFMAMADVRPFQYLLGTMASTLLVATGMLLLFALIGGYIGIETLWFVAIGVSGGIVSILVGMVLGLSKVPIIAQPIAIILGLGPGFSAMNENLANVLRFTFIQQVHLAMAGIGEGEDISQNFVIILINGLVVFAVFAVMHRRNRLNV